MKVRTKAILGLVVVLALTGVAAVTVRDDKNGSGPATVTVARGDILDKAVAVGTNVPEVEISVRAEVSGAAHRRYSDPGDFVQVGALLLEIKPDPTPLEWVEGRRGTLSASRSRSTA